MKQLFLTSSVSGVAHDLVKRVDLSVAKKLLFINTAAELDKGSKQWEANDRRALVDVGFEVTDYTISDKDRQTLKRDLETFSCIYLSGGNTFYLLQQAQKTGFDTVITDLVTNQNKIFIGTSAGSIIAGPNIDYIKGMENLTQAPDVHGSQGFSLTNLCVFPHWGSNFFKADYLTKVIMDAYSTDFPCVTLRDNQYVYQKNESFEIISV